MIRPNTRKKLRWQLPKLSAVPTGGAISFATVSATILGYLNLLDRVHDVGTKYNIRWHTLALPIAISLGVAVWYVAIRSIRHSPPNRRDFLVAFLPSVFVATLIGWRYAPSSTQHLLRSLWGPPQVDLIQSAPEAQISLTNFPWLTYGQDFGQVAAWNKPQGVSRRRSDFDGVFSALSGAGVRTVAWWLLSDGRGGPTFDDRGVPTGLSEDFWADYNAALELARKYDIGILWVLVDNQLALPTEAKNGANLFGHADVVAEETHRAAFLNNVVVPIASAYRYERQIVGWVLMNEPETVVREGQLSRGALKAFVREASQKIRSVTHNQPISIAFGDAVAMVDYWNDDIGRDVDFYVFHHYESRLPPPVAWLHELMGHTTKPIYVGEFNLSNTNESSRFLRWSYLLGYQGTWWWSLNSRCPDRYPCRESVDIPLIQFNAVKDTKRLVGDLSANRNARAAFQIRRELSSDGLRAVDQADWSFWLSEGQVILAALNDLTGSSSSEQGLRNELLQRRNDIKKLSSELEKDTPSCVTINDAEVAKKKLDVDRLKEEIRKQKQILIDRPDGDLDEALRAQTKHYIADYEDQLERAGLRLQEAVAKRASCDGWRAKSQRFLFAAERREAAITAELDEVGRTNPWRNRVYADFWRGEIDWARSAGLLR